MSAADSATKRKKVGRTKLDASVRRDTKLSVNFNESELVDLDAHCAEVHSTRAEYCRRAAINTVPKSVPEANRFLRENIWRIGSNINQIARKLNSNGLFTASLEKQTTALYDELEAAMKLLNAQIAK